MSGGGGGVGPPLEATDDLKDDLVYWLESIGAVENNTNVFQAGPALIGVCVYSVYLLRLCVE